MNTKATELAEPTLVGKNIELKPLQLEHKMVLLEAAADGELWNSRVTVVPGPETITEYISTAIAGRQAGTVIPFIILQRNTGQVVGSTLPSISFEARLLT